MFDLNLASGKVSQKSIWEALAQMAQTVTLDAMIPRQDFAVEGDEFVLDLFRDLPITTLYRDSPIMKLLRKPDFQRETNHWSPEQISVFIASFLDNEVIPSIILWKSPSFIFVIDGGHRISALRAWMEDDYGDKAISRPFYNHEISEQQKRIATRTRKLVEGSIGRFTTLRDLVGGQGALVDRQIRRAGLLFTRTMQVQWIQGSAAVAETSFFKINSQGTPLDDIEEMLIRNRRKPVAISARALLRAGSGNKYWSAFDNHKASRIETLASGFYDLVFKPESSSPVKTLDLPLGGTVSPVEALSLLVEFLTIAGTRELSIKQIADYPVDEDGSSTIKILENALQIVNKFTGATAGSLGLHPAVYFYNEKGRFSRFLFLGMTMLITQKVRDNDQRFFIDFAMARRNMEIFLVDNKSLIGRLLQNMAKGQRVHKMRDLFAYLIYEHNEGRDVTVEKAIAKMGLQGRIIDVVGTQTNSKITDDTKSMIYVREALKAALKCPHCFGLLDPTKSISYDHKKPVREGGHGGEVNVDLTHPFCNSARDAIDSRKGKVA